MTKEQTELADAMWSVGALRSQHEAMAKLSFKITGSHELTVGRIAMEQALAAAAPAEGPGEVLQGLYARMAEKVPVLREMARDQGIQTTSRMIERARLNGKAEGVALAAGYVDEAIRSLVPSVAVTPGVPVPDHAGEGEGQ